MNALEERIRELVHAGGRLDIAWALFDLDPEIQERREIAYIEDMLRAAPDFMWDELLQPDRPVSPYDAYLAELRAA